MASAPPTSTMGDPIPTRQGQVSIDGRKMDIVCSQFTNRTFLLISEHQKLGTLMDVTRDPVVTAGHTHCPSYSVRTLLGKDQAEVQVFGRALASHMLAPTGQPSRLLLCLCLTDHSPQTLQSLLTHMDQYIITS